MAARNLIIECPHVILCEGQDEKHFLEWYLRSAEMKEADPRFASEIQVIDFGGVKELARFIKTLRSIPGYETVRSVLIIQDAESDAEASKQRIQNVLKNNGYPAPWRTAKWSEEGLPRVAFLLFPELGAQPKPGTLEDLCLDILRKKYAPEAIIAEVESDIRTLRDAQLRTFPREFKTKLHGFFALTDPFVGLKIGEAAQANAFDWNHEKLSELRRCLLEVLRSEL